MLRAGARKHHRRSAQPARGEVHASDDAKSAQYRLSMTATHFRYLAAAVPLAALVAAALFLTIGYHEPLPSLDAVSHCRGRERRR